jgi:CRP/FNR family transcriptional regulator, anaerobic regulatory protein
MSGSILDCHSCPVSDKAACASLPPEARERLATLGRHLHFKRGDTVFATGDGPPACATLVSGALKITRFDANGDEHILSIVHPSGFVGEMFAPVAQHDVIALTDCRLCVFSQSQYRSAMAEFPALAAALLRRTDEELFDTRSLLALAGKRGAQQKLAGLIMALARAASHTPCHPALHFDLLLTRGEIASMLGLTIETVSRQLGKIEIMGLIERTGARGILLRDAKALEDIAEG